MGNMTVVSVLTDAMDTIKENPEQFINNISEGMNLYSLRKINSYGVGNHANPMMVHQAFHDMSDQLILVGHGYMTNIADMKTGFSDKSNALRVKGNELLKARQIMQRAERAYFAFAQEIALETVKGLNQKDVSVEEFSNILQEHGILDGISDESLVLFIQNVYDKWKGDHE